MAFAPRAMQHAVSSLLGFDRLERLYESVSGPSLVSNLLDRLEVSYQISGADAAHVPRKGAAVLTCNHPTGMLEGAVLLDALREVRPDVKILANGLLGVVPELREWLIEVDPIGRSAKQNHTGMRKAIEWLAAGGLLVVFPAGSVSHYRIGRGVTDEEWNENIARLIRVAARHTDSLSVVPAFLSGRNSTAFHLLGLISAKLRTAMLIRELLNKRQTRMEVRIGKPVPAARLDEMETDGDRIRYLRWRTDLLEGREAFHARTRSPLKRATSVRAETIAPPVEERRMRDDVSPLTPLVSSGKLHAYLAPAAAIPNVLQEIGRLREITFRAAGEGTGRAEDLDDFDAHYLHLFVWNEEKGEVAGAYRLCGTDAAVRGRGVRGLYTSTLFRYGQSFLRHMGPALELGRSWVRPEYQKSFGPLLLLWKGIGRFVAAHPQYKVLFGPVSISNQYQAMSRHLMVSFLERFESLEEWKHLVSTRNPFRARRAVECDQFLRARPKLEELAEVVSDLEPNQEGVPVLLRQYLKLGGRLLGFNVDPEFSNALDGLIVVDLTRTEPKLLERYLGVPEAASFLSFHKGTR